MIKQKLAKIFPNKEKSTIIIIVMILVAVVIFIFFFSSGKISFLSGNKKTNIEDQTILGLIQADTDGDGILDWEEALWGTDKNISSTFEGMTDQEYVDAKKKELRIEQDTGDTRLTETEKFAREFFSAYTALRAGDADSVTVNSFANALGQRVANPSLINQYQAKDVKIKEIDTVDTRNSYYNTLKGFFEEAKDSGLGEELELVGQGVLANTATGETVDLQKLLVIANAYQEFAKKVMGESVPASIQDIHLQIANSANNTGISVLNMNSIITDPVVGISGLSQYQKYSDDLINAVEDLETVLFE